MFSFVMARSLRWKIIRALRRMMVVIVLTVMTAAHDTGSILFVLLCILDLERKTAEKSEIINATCLFKQ